MRSLILIYLAAVLSGCTLAPTYKQPPSPIAATYTATSPDAPTAPLATDLTWRQFFVDERLQALIATALERNRDLAQSYARINQARAQYRISSSARLPNVEVSGGATRTSQPAGAVIPGVGTGNTAGSIEFDQFNANAAVSAFELDLWGRVRNLAEADRQRYLASTEGARAFRLSLIAQVASAYFDIRAGEARIALAERSIEGRQEGVRIAKLRLDAGVTSTIDYDQTVLLLTQAKAELVDIQRRTEQAGNLLDVLTGGPLTGPFPEGLRLDQQVVSVSAGLPSDLLRNRPDILQAEHDLRAANADIGAARAAFFPTITLTGNYGFASNALDSLFKSANQNWSYGGVLNLPIFDWGKRRSQLRLSRAKADELTAAYQRAVQGAFQEVNDSLVGRRRYAEHITALTETVAAQERLTRAARLRYDNGISIYLQVLDSERGLFSATQELIQLRAVELQNAVSLYTALGGDAGSITQANARGVPQDASGIPAHTQDPPDDRHQIPCILCGADS